MRLSFIVSTNSQGCVVRPGKPRGENEGDRLFRSVPLVSYTHSRRPHLETHSSLAGSILMECIILRLVGMVLELTNHRRRCLSVNIDWLRNVPRDGVIPAVEDGATAVTSSDG